MPGRCLSFTTLLIYKARVVGGGYFDRRFYRGNQVQYTDYGVLFSEEHLPKRNNKHHLIQ